MSNNINVSSDYWILAIVLAYFLFLGKPDIQDAIIYKLTGVHWEAE